MRVHFWRKCISCTMCYLGLERGVLSEAKRSERRGENVYLNPYSHIDQALVEVRFARDNNDPDLGTRHVSVLLSFPLSIKWGSGVLLGFTPRPSRLGTLQ